MPTYCLAPVIPLGAQVFSNQGVVLAGGKVYTYVAGSTTPAATYTSSTGSVANANPITLDSAGRLTQPIWLTAGTAYKFVITDSNGVNVGMTLDNVSGVNDLTVAAPPVSVVTLSADYSGSISYAPLKFQSALLNTGSAYNPTTGLYTVPYTGVYLINLMLNVTPSASTIVYASVQNQIATEYVTAGNRGMLNVTYVASLTAGDTLSASAYVTSGTLTVTAKPDGGPSRGSTLSIALLSGG